jgi:hypothetical protein
MIPLPDEIESLAEEIIEVTCGKRHSIILAKSGKMWATGNIKEEKEAKIEKLKKEQAEEEEQPEEEIGGYKKKGRGGKRSKKDDAKKEEKKEEENTGKKPKQEDDTRGKGFKVRDKGSLHEKKREHKEN